MKRKHSLRSLLSMVCVIAMVISMVPVLPVAAAADVFNDNMENYTVGTDLYTQAGDKYTKTSPAWGNSSFTAASQGNVAVVADPTNSTNKVLAVTSAGQSKRYVLTVGPKVTGDYTLQFDYMPATAVSNAGSGFVDIYINDGKNQIARVNYRTYGSYFYLDGASASPMAKNSDINKDNTWYSVRVVVSEDEYTMDIWEKGAKDDTLITTTATKNQKANAGTNVEFCFGPYDSAWGMDTSKPITNYIDNIRITPGVVEASDGAKDDGAVAVSGGGMVTFNDAHKIVNTEAVAVTAGMGLFAGTPEGNFDPTGTVTRAQMATIIVKMLRGNAFNADNFKGFDKFSDTASFEGGWAEGYINACVQMGVVAGYGDGTFKPEKAVTTAEALTMIINALKVNAGEGEWPNTIMAKAQEMKLYGDMTTKPGTYDALTRDQLAVLTCEGMYYSPSGVTGYKVPGSDIVFTDISDAIKANGGITGITEVVGEDALANKVYELEIAEGYIVENQANSDNEYTVVRAVKENDNGTFSYQDYWFNMETELGEIGHYVTVYYREEYENDKKPGVVYNYVDETQVVTVEEAINTSKDYKEAFGKEIKPAKVMIDLNSAYDWQTPVKTLVGYTAGDAAKTGTYFIYEGEIVGYMPLVPVYAAKVRAVNTFDGNETIELSGVAAPISNSEDNDRILEYGKIKKDDYVTYVKVGGTSNPDDTIYVLSQTTTAKGTVSKTFTNEDGDKVVTVKDVDYVQFGGINDITEFKNLPTLSYTDSYTFFLTEDGEYLGYEKTEGGLNLNETVFILGENTVVTKDDYGNRVRKTTARGIDMTGKEVNLLLKVEKNGTLENGVYFPSMNPKDNIYHGVSNGASYASVAGNTFYTFELSNDKEAKKEEIYVLTPYPATYNKETAPIYTGTRTISDGGAYAFSNFSCNGKNTYYHGSTVYILLEGNLNQTTPLTAEVKKSWATSTNTSGAPLEHFYLLSRNESDSQMLDVALVLAKDALSAAGTQVVYVSAENQAPAGTNADGYLYDVFDYKTGAKKQIALKTDDALLVDVDGNGVANEIPAVGYWHTRPESGSNCSVLVEKVVDTGTFTGTTSNSSSNDKLYTENIAHDQTLVELAEDELNTTSGTRLRKASGSIVVDTRSEEDINAAGIGKISSVDRLGTLAIDNPEVTVIFDLCYSSTSNKMLTIFIKDVSFKSVDGGSKVVNVNGVWYLDGRVVDPNTVTVTDNSGRLQADPADTLAVLTELETAIANGKTVTVTYNMNNGKVSEIAVTGILAADELFVEMFEGYAVGSMGQSLPGNFDMVWNTGTGDYNFEIVDEGGNKAFKGTNTESKRIWFKPAGVYSGNYTFETKIMIGDTNSTFDLRWRNIDLIDSENDYTLRVNSSGELFQVYGTNTTKIALTRNAWYKVVVEVDESNGKVKTEVFDASGASIATREENCGNFAAYETVGPTIDFNGAGTYFVDDIIITKGAEMAQASTYTVKAERIDANGLIDVDKNAVKAGETVTVTTTAKAGYKLDQLLVNGVDILTQPGYSNDNLDSVVETVVTITANTVIQAKFVKIAAYTVTVEQADANGSVAADKTGEVTEGEVITITATAYNSDTHTLKSIKVNGVEIATTSPATYTMVDEDAVITAEFGAYNFYTVSTPAVANGSVSVVGVNANGGQWRENDTITITATPATGWEVNAIYVDGVAISGTSFVLTKDTEVTAVFWPVGAQFYEGFDGYTAGTDLPVASGEKFVYHMKQGTYANKVVNEDGGLVLELTATDDGSAGTNATTGAQLASRAWPKTSKKFDGNFTIETRFKYVAASGGLTCLRLVDLDVPNASGMGDFELRFKTDGYVYVNKVTAANALSGETVGSTTSLYLYSDAGAKVVTSGGTWYTVKLHVNSADGTVVVELYDDNGLLGSRTVNGAVLADGGTAVGVDHQSDNKGNSGVTRTSYWDYFAVTDYQLVIPESNVTVVAPDDCEVTVDKDTAVKAGETVTITVGAYDTDKYKAPVITVVTASGGAVDVTDNTFKMPGEDVTVTATFEEIFYGAVNTTVDETLGSISVDPAANPDKGYKEGEEVKFTVTVTDAENNYVSGVTMNGTPLIPENGVYSFEMPTTNAAVVATIEAKPTYDVTIDSTIANGNVTADKDPAKYRVNDPVTLTVTPDPTYALGTLSVTKAGGAVQYTDNGDGTYTFAMPAEPVTVTATFQMAGLNPVDDFESYTAGADLPTGTGYAFASADTVATGNGNPAATSKVQQDSGNQVLELYVKPGRQSNQPVSSVWLTTSDAFGNGTIVMKVKVSGNMDHAAIKLFGESYVLKFSGGSATVGSSVVAPSVSDDTWYTVEIKMEGTNVTTTLKDASGTTTLGTANTTVSGAAAAMTIGIQAVGNSGGNVNKAGYFYVDDIKTFTGN